MSSDSKGEGPFSRFRPHLQSSLANRAERATELLAGSADAQLTPFERALVDFSAKHSSGVNERAINRIEASRLPISPVPAPIEIAGENDPVCRCGHTERAHGRPAPWARLVCGRCKCMQYKERTP